MRSQPHQVRVLELLMESGERSARSQGSLLVRAFKDVGAARSALLGFLDPPADCRWRHVHGPADLIPTCAVKAHADALVFEFLLVAELLLRNLLFEPPGQIELCPLVDGVHVDLENLRDLAVAQTMLKQHERITPLLVGNEVRAFADVRFIQTGRRSV